MRQDVRLTSYSHGGGCACKLGSSELSEILVHVRSTSADPAVMVGLDTPDDAAVYRVSDDTAIVQTVDFFTPIVDDAYTWGRIASTNALSDIYAMGARPVTALNLVGWPRTLDFEILGRVLNGANDACEAAGAAIVGGHSIDDPEPKFGQAVTGIVHPDHIVRNGGVVPGDALVLTKPLGVGIISSGIKQGAIVEADAIEAIESMTQLNKNACEAMLAVGPRAATDVTGFGLIGHLMEMLGGLSARLEFGAIPILAQAIELAGQGILPGGSKRNQEAHEERVTSSGLDPARRSLLFDAQTSGGLLIAVTPDKSSALVDALHERGVTAAARIGEVVDGPGIVEVAA